jgi:hypothetical protein
MRITSVRVVDIPAEFRNDDSPHGNKFKYSVLCSYLLAIVIHVELFLMGYSALWFDEIQPTFRETFRLHLQGLSHY